MSDYPNWKVRRHALLAAAWVLETAAALGIRLFVWAVDWDEVERKVREWQ